MNEPLTPRHHPDPLVPEPTVRSRPADFRSVVEQYQRPVVALAFDLTGSYHDAEDLAQDVFIKAYRHLRDFRGEAELFSWLYRITVNTFLNQRRKKALRFRQLWDGATLEAEPAAAIGPDRRAEADGMRRHVEAALGRLSPRERSAFVLRHYHDLPIREVAATLDVAEGTVKSLLYRAAHKLRDALAFYREDLGLKGR